jgi:hypothetical protein
MRGLDPRIHLQKRMDCRVKPGNDDLGDKLGIESADIRHPDRYINPARHVRAFGVRMGILQ